MINFILVVIPGFSLLSFPRKRESRTDDVLMFPWISGSSPKMTGGVSVRVKPEDDKSTPPLFNSAYISNGGQRVVLVFNKAHCFAHKNLPPATFYLRSPVKTGIQNVGSRRITRTSLFLDLRWGPKMTGKSEYPGQARR